VKLLWNALAVAALLAMLATAAFAQRYTPPGNGGGNNNNGNGNNGTTPAQHNPDPFGLTLAASGAAAAVGYVMRRRREAS